MDKHKVFSPYTDKQTEKQMGQTLDAHEFRGHNSKSSDAVQLAR